MSSFIYKIELVTACLLVISVGVENRPLVYNNRLVCNPEIDWTIISPEYSITSPRDVDSLDICTGRHLAYGGLPPVAYLTDTVIERPVPKKIHSCKYCRRRRLNNKRQNNKPSNYREMHRGMFKWPIIRDKFWISTYYGRRSRGRMHKGVDLAALRGTPVRASASGVVELSCNAGTFGNMVLIRHNNVFKSRYAHLKKFIVFPGDRVIKGQIIGYVGNTGRVSGDNGDHLHFEIISNERPINPIYMLV